MRVLITGGAGFIGCNAAVDLMRSGDEVIVFDNLSRTGTADNLAWIQGQGELTFIKGDIREYEQIRDAIRQQRPDAVIHLAAQVAVTTSVVDPRTDFEINALGTLNVLEAVREAQPSPMLVFSSTNKVYGGMEELEYRLEGDRYVCEISAEGVPETRPLDFHSPYGCSKGAADQYVRDYARIYDLRTVVLRQSCIYGNRQFGIEEQGWLAWFTLAACMGRPITIYGDGKQVRDVLEVSDLVRLYRLCIEQMDTVSGQVLNVGGGPDKTLSILQSLELLEKELGLKIERTFDEWRPGDQPIFISCNQRARRLLGWEPQVDVEQGLRRLVQWIRPNLEQIRTLLGR
jgi:CDP-paratose 2-epimerase